jgi:hypothetical protein
MIENAQEFYDKAKLLGMSPYEFDNHVIRYDIFNMKNGHVENINTIKYMEAATKVLNEMKGK